MSGTDWVNARKRTRATPTSQTQSRPLESRKHAVKHMVWLEPKTDCRPLNFFEQVLQCTIELEKESLWLPGRANCTRTAGAVAHVAPWQTCRSLPAQPTAQGENCKKLATVQARLFFLLDQLAFAGFRALARRKSGLLMDCARSCRMVLQTAWPQG